MVTVIGLGFVGLTTALGLCELGEKVYGIETNEAHLSMLKDGEIPFFEPELRTKLRQYQGSQLILDGLLCDAVRESEAVFFCVGTPYGNQGSADLSQLYAAMSEVLDSVRDDRFRVLIIKSTIPPGTTAGKILPFVEGRGFKVPKQIGIATNPEFLREGHCWEDFIRADRVVIGTEDEASERVLRGIYKNASCPVASVSYNTSEFIKYLSNASLACLISFSNEMSLAADAIGGVDIAEAFDIVRMDKRWQTGSIRSYFYPGCGYGGYCLPKDTNALYSAVKTAGHDCTMLREIITINDSMPGETAERIIAVMEKAPESIRTIGILGLSFNVGSDDVRDTPAAKVIRCLHDRGCQEVIAYDPHAIENFKRSYPDINCVYAEDYETIAEQADILVLVTPWKEFLDVHRYGKPVIDCRYALR